MPKVNKSHFSEIYCKYWKNISTSDWMYSQHLLCLPLPELTRYYQCKLPTYGVMSYPLKFSPPTPILYLECCFVVTRFGAFLTLLKALRIVYILLTISIFILPYQRKVLDTCDWNIQIVNILCGMNIHLCGMNIHPCGMNIHPCGMNIHPCGMNIHPCGMNIHPCGMNIDPCGMNIHLYLQNLFAIATFFDTPSNPQSRIHWLKEFLPTCDETMQLLECDISCNPFEPNQPVGWNRKLWATDGITEALSESVSSRQKWKTSTS